MGNPLELLLLVVSCIAAWQMLDAYCTMKARKQWEGESRERESRFLR